MAKKKWIPRKGQVFSSREDLETKLVDEGWLWTGQGSDLEDGGVVGYDLVVMDEKKTLSIVVHMEPVVRVVKIQRTRIR
ncbi:hypothetical protein LCGC14_0971170 [marine sediment metagenome]|uniref:Uncharacterized protein n=1 Tax=marine sediment metagenome TaxID=412755 RepID=A0A0F9NXU6_9ZZZZ